MMNLINDTALVVVGWDTDANAYHQFKSLKTCTNLDIYVASHRPTTRELEPDFFTVCPTNRPLDETGMDWGAYSCWLQEKHWKRYEWVFFMHTDVFIRRPELLEVAKERMIKKNLAAIANGRGANPSRQVLRGSFVGMPVSTLHSICGEFVVPSWRNDYHQGNVSMLATTQRILQCTGKQIGWLGYKLQDTDWLIETSRGSKNID